ncbi:MAG: serine/threonine protein kinase [Deltaproteobacteria bacterium]|nr:MAG: serine/threonine protein kinase [Deltaproteobacteria bacterium]
MSSYDPSACPQSLGALPEHSTVELPPDGAAPVPPCPVERDIAAGDLVGDYIVRSEIAAGGCGTVYEAEHRVLGRRAAVKVLHPELSQSAEMVQRFVTEARSVASIAHPNVVEVYEFGHYRDRPFFAMERIDGPRLDEVVEREGPLPLSRAIELVAPVCSAAHAAHAVGVIHRDIKASNVLIDRRGGAERVKLVDFGVARLLTRDGLARLTRSRRRIGTPRAMAPEQVCGGTVDARTDVYALGVLAYFLLSGRYPFEGRGPVDVAMLHATAPPPPPSRFAPIPAAVERVVLRALAKDPAQRFSSAVDLCDALRAAAAADTSPPGGAPADVRAAVGVFVELIPAAPRPGARDVDGAAAAARQVLLRALREAGLAVSEPAPTSLVGVRVADADTAAAVIAAWRDAERAAAQVEAEAGARKWGGLRVVVRLRVDRAYVRAGGRGLRVVGGPLVAGDSA